MISLSDVFISAIANANNPFAEDITYYPTGSTGKVIKAVSKRGAGSFGRPKIDPFISYAAEIIIGCNDDGGIETVTPRKDYVIMDAPEINDSTHKFTVAGIISKSKMAWHLGLTM